MSETLRGGLSLSLCGFGFWSHDIGGFEGGGPAAFSASDRQAFAAQLDRFLARR